MPLRERQAAAAREAILEAFLDSLEDEPPHEISMEALAERAGTSRRTLFRYFPTRANLLAAAADWIYDHRLHVPIEIDGAGNLVESFTQASAEAARLPALARALLNTPTGQTIRSGRRARRAAAIGDAVAEITTNLPPEQAAQATAIITHLCSARAWITIQDESGLDSASARAAVAWALATLIGELRLANDASRPSPSTRAKPPPQPAQASVEDHDDGLSTQGDRIRRSARGGRPDGRSAAGSPRTSSAAQSRTAPRAARVAARTGRPAARSSRRQHEVAGGRLERAAIGGDRSRQPRRWEPRIRRTRVPAPASPLRTSGTGSRIGAPRPRLRVTGVHVHVHD